MKVVAYSIKLFEKEPLAIANHKKHEITLISNGLCADTVSGGLTWFVSKRFALETNLLSASATYAKSERTGTTNVNSSGYKNTYSNFNLSSTGAISNLGFKVYILF